MPSIFNCETIVATFTKTVVFTDIANYTLSTAKSVESGLLLIEDHEIHKAKYLIPTVEYWSKNSG